MKVSNPLTTIAIFAGVAEGFATGALVALPQELQAYFMVFVMAFPCVIVLAFFLTLWLNPVVLYAPSDYDDPEHFLIANKLRHNFKAVAEDFFRKLSEENQPISKESIPGLVKELQEEVLESSSTGLEDRVVSYLQAHPREAFTDRALGHILIVGRRSVRETLELLEEKGKVAKGIEPETGILLWQINQ